MVWRTGLRIYGVQCAGYRVRDTGCGNHGLNLVELRRRTVDVRGLEAGVGGARGVLRGC